MPLSEVVIFSLIGVFLFFSARYCKAFCLRAPFLRLRPLFKGSYLCLNALVKENDGEDKDEGCFQVV